MPFDQQTRNRLQRFVSDARSLLTEECTRQLQHTYGLDPGSRSVTPIESLHLDDARRGTARILRDTLAHYIETSPSASTGDVLERIVREQAFTVLNRLCALRMAEARGILIESLAAGYNSRGFQLYARLVGTGLGETGDAYRNYLFSIFDEFALDLKALFDRFSPQGLLFPREPALLDLLNLINDHEIASLWSEDETIGWIYQYFNSKEERKKMREESAAPRDSRELAVRNQFFTPRYVVAFLTDNTLGRIWYEMMRGNTKLVGQCQYLVRRPCEIFLGHPKLAYSRIFGKPESELTIDAAVAAAYQGDLSKIPDFSGRDSRWIAVAIPPDQAEKISGEKDFIENPKLQAVIDSVLEGHHNADIESLPLLWSALSYFALNDGGGAYSIEPWKKLWNQFVNLARQDGTEKSSQDDLLKEPVFIPHRPLKDPRDIKMLDPACGSMHFGLYAFDLFETIYKEAWEFAQSLREGGRRPEDAWAYEEFAPFVAFASQYPSWEAFAMDVPRLIIEHNLHGIDIDPRAVQIAGLSLWLRAQRSWQQQGVKAGERPRINRSNIVCAEPMPGEEKLLKEFVDKNLSASPELRLLGQLVRHVFEGMKLAGEAGSLLKIETEIADAVTEAKRKWIEVPTPKQDSLFAGMARPEQQRLGYEVKGITDEAFWERAEKLIYEALGSYAEQSENRGGYQRRLFADDAARGFAFIDQSRQRYDVILMNPPFGYAPESLLASVGDRITDIDALFVSRGVELLASTGRLGVITNRTQLMKPALATFREHNLQGRARLQLCADLGSGVLDALVETAAYIVDRSLTNWVGMFANGLGIRNKESVIERCARLEAVRLIDIRSFKEIPDNRFAHWLHPDLLILFGSCEKLNVQQAVVFGLSTTDNFRFMRLRWEVGQLSVINFNADCNGWVPLAKGGDYSPYAGDVHLVVDWRKGGASLRAMPSAPIRNEEVYGRAGLTFTKRTASAFAPRVLPDGCIVEVNGPSITPREGVKTPAYETLGILCSRVNSYLSDAMVAAGDTSVAGSAAKDYIPGVIGQLPIPRCCNGKVATLVERVVRLAAQIEALEETSNCFLAPFSLFYSVNSSSPNARFKYAAAFVVSALVEQATKAGQYLRMVEDSFGLTEGARRELDLVVGPIPGDSAAIVEKIDEPIAILVRRSNEQIVSSALSRGITRKDISKNAYHSDRRLELLASLTCATLDEVGAVLESEWAIPRDWTKREVSFVLGVVFGRWDIKSIGCEITILELSNPFAPLSVCPPGMLRTENGLPAEPVEVPESYPLRISWSGILVDAPGHTEDIEGRAREALQVIWPERADSIEQETCETLGVLSLREYFRKPNLFFADHLSRYSKSRRQAPIYWPVSTSSISYTLWLYYHRLNDQTLYSCINDFIGPNLRETSETLNKLRAVSNRTRAEEDELARLQDFELELQDLRDELLRLAKLPWRPNLNDGVQITAAPLWKLFRLPKWQKTLKETWQNLEKGDYDWAHLAMTIWPQRVVPKCVEDRSLAITHDVEDLFWVEDFGRWRQLEKSAQEIEIQKRRQKTESRTRLRKLLTGIVESADKRLTAEDIRQLLAEGEWDDKELALLLYPKRVAEKCWNDPGVAKKLNVKLPTKRTKTSLPQFIKKLTDSGCPDLADPLDTSLRDRSEAYHIFWSALEQGNYDDLAIAFSLWPDRVIDKSTADVNLAERHDVRKFLWTKDFASGEWRRREDPDSEVAREIARRRGGGQHTSGVAV